MEQQVFIARQPILDRTRRVVGYELLFRPSDRATSSRTSTAQASARVMTDAVVSFGLDTLTYGRLAFINVTRSLLLEDLAGLEEILPPSKVVLELIEDIEADDEVVTACQRLRKTGYALALDDFVLTERNAGLVSLATYVKLDQPDVTQPDAVARIRALRPDGGLLLLAEKVETADQFAIALAAGFDYFQGFFFGRPATQSARTIAVRQVGHMRLIEALQDPDLDLARLQRLIEHDPSLCYRLLRTANSAIYGQVTPVTSIRQAIVLMGVGTVRRWASLWLLAGLGETAHPELLTMATVRARACELLAAEVGGIDGSEGFLLGMCSLLDVILDQPMPALVEKLPLSADARAALLGDDGPGRRILDCVIAQERGNVASDPSVVQCECQASSAALSAHQSALRWSAEFLHVV